MCWSSDTEYIQLARTVVLPSLSQWWVYITVLKGGDINTNFAIQLQASNYLQPGSCASSSGWYLSVLAYYLLSIFFSICAVWQDIMSLCCLYMEALSGLVCELRVRYYSGPLLDLSGFYINLLIYTYFHSVVHMDRSNEMTRRCRHEKYKLLILIERWYNIKDQSLG